MAKSNAMCRPCWNGAEISDGKKVFPSRAAPPGGCSSPSRAAPRDGSSPRCSAGFLPLVGLGR
jgi:hypothetical protein